MAGPGPGSGLTLEQLRARVKVQATFAEPDTTIDEWLNEKHKQMIVQSEWDTRLASLGTTVANTSTYDLSPEIVQLHKLRVGGSLYSPGGVETVWNLRAGDARLVGGGGVFAQTYEADGTPQIDIFPTPDETGQTLEGLATYTPGDVSGSDYPLAPEDLHEAIADGAIALGYRLRAENSGEAAEFESRFQSAIAELRRRKNARVSGGPSQIGVKGYHW